MDGIPDDLVDRAHAATDEALFSALIEPCVAAAISLDHDGADEALQQAVRDWLRTLMALDEDYDVHDSQLDASSFARLDASLSALRAAVRT